jgi:hypothetical protein
MTDCSVPSLLAAARSDDEGLVNLIVTVIIVAIWLIASLSKAKSRKPPSPSETADHPMEEESVSGSSQAPSGTYEEEAKTFESPEPQSDDTLESFPEPVTIHRPLPSLPGSFETEPVPNLPQASADTSVWESGIAFMEPAETESVSMSYSMAGLWTHTDLGGGGNDPIMARLDPEQLRQAIVINEILAEPLSMRPID